MQPMMDEADKMVVGIKTLADKANLLDAILKSATPDTWSEQIGKFTFNEVTVTARLWHDGGIEIIEWVGP